MENKNFIPPVFIGQCIYCRKRCESLQDEHVIPYGLGGDLKLLKASCKKCADVTSAFEGEILRNVFLPARAKLKLPTRHKKNRPEKFPLSIEKNGQRKDIEVPISEHFTTVTLPEFKLPAFLERRSYKRDIELIALSMSPVGKPQIKEITKKHDAQSLIIENSFTHAFPRLLAKIAYGFAISEFGLGKMQKTYVLPAILGESKDIGRWVGCLPYSKQRTAGEGLHVLRLHMIHKKVVLAYVRLFASCDTPEYLVVIGTL